MHRFTPPPISGFGPGSEPNDPYAPTAPPLSWAPPPVVEHPGGTTILVLGLVSVLVFPFLGPYTWWKARATLREIDAAPFVTGNRSAVAAGQVLGVVGTVFAVVLTLYFLLLVGLVAAGL